MVGCGGTNSRGGAVPVAIVVGNVAALLSSGNKREELPPPFYPPPSHTSPLSFLSGLLCVAEGSNTAFLGERV